MCVLKTCLIYTVFSTWVSALKISINAVSSACHKHVPKEELRAPTSSLIMPWAPQTCTRLLSVPLPFLLFTTKHRGSRSRKGGTCFFKSHLIASSTFTNQSKDKHGEEFMARRLWQGTDGKEMLRWLKGKSGCG